ncbi:MAG: C1 family peptidase, partial [Eubacteriales bacterium]
SQIDGSELKFQHEEYCGEKLPVQIDLRPNCPAVYDQGNEGSCTANAGCAGRSMLEGDPNLTLSRAFQYYMERSLLGTTEEDSGASIKDIILSMKQYGVCKEVDMPYIPGDFKTPPSEQAKKNALQYKIEGGKLLHGIAAIQTALCVRSQPVLLGMKVYASMESGKVAGTGVLPMPGRKEAFLGSHAVLVVGYLPELPSYLQETKKAAKASRKKQAAYLVVRNSWGAGWGDKGYFYMPFAYVDKGYAFEAWIMEK